MEEKICFNCVHFVPEPDMKMGDCMKVGMIYFPATFNGGDCAHYEEYEKDDKES